MKGVFRSNAKISGVTGAQLLLYVTAPADAVLEIISATISNSSNDTNEQVDVRLSHFDVFPTDGSQEDQSITPENTEGGGSSGCTSGAGIPAAGEPTYTSDAHMEGVSILTGYRFQPVPETREYVNPGESIGLRTASTITSTDLIAVIEFRVIGGAN